MGEEAVLMVMVIVEPPTHIIRRFEVLFVCGWVAEGDPPTTNSISPVLVSKCHQVLLIECG